MEHFVEPDGAVSIMWEDDVEPREGWKDVLDVLAGLQRASVIEAVSAAGRTSWSFDVVIRPPPGWTEGHSAEFASIASRSLRWQRWCPGASPQQVVVVAEMDAFADGRDVEMRTTILRLQYLTPSDWPDIVEIPGEAERIQGWSERIRESGWAVAADVRAAAVEQGYDAVKSRAIAALPVFLHLIRWGIATQ